MPLAHASKLQKSDTPDPFQPGKHVAQRPHTAPSAPSSRTSRSQPPVAMRQDVHVSQVSRNEPGPTHLPKDQQDKLHIKAQETWGCHATQDATPSGKTWQINSRASSATPTQKGIVRPLSCQRNSRIRSCNIESRTDHSLIAQSNKPEKPSSASAMTRSHTRALCSYLKAAQGSTPEYSCNGSELVQDPADSPQGDSHLEPKTRDHVTACQGTHVMHADTDVSSGQGLQDWDQSMSSLAITSAACTSAQTVHPHPEVITEPTTTTVHSTLRQSLHSDADAWGASGHVQSWLAPDAMLTACTVT